MTESPVHLAVLQRGVSHLTACGQLSRLVTFAPRDATCPECVRIARIEAARVPGHLVGCVSGKIDLAPFTVGYCPCIHGGGR